ncbi:MAG: RNA polymerase subunit sigma-24 [Cytophagales bacterium CG18_big_fil_WC_8_21_14_2_50_42_9]|nr:MAG: RNA polymerase subunit sigma-24 [Cytophagales bacterium CG18_big_fil_WC_8_21_14_2_50_42_9]
MVQGCIAGKRLMQKNLYDLYAKKMMAVCLRYSRTSFEAEDIMQEAFIKVFEHLQTFKGECPLEFWIRRIMINTALKHHRKMMHVSSAAENEKIENVPEEEFIFSGYAYEELLAMIQSLAPRYQLIFNLYAIEGYPHKEIAAMLDISEGTSKSQYSRARAILKNMLEQHEQKYNERVIR